MLSAPQQRPVCLLSIPAKGRLLASGRRAGARRRARGGAAVPVQAVGGGAGAEEPADSLQSQKQLLNRLFFSAAATESVLEEELEGGSGGSGGSKEGGGEVLPPLPGVLHDVPLWRVQWPALPGHQELYHVHVPHYCDMFSRLFAGPRPWRFGHLYLPQGSQNLGNSEYAMAPGTQAPLVGTLCEVLQAVRIPDGRLLVLAVGVGRFKVVRSRQEVPHSRADIVVLPDYEEVQQQQETALDALEEAGAGGDLPVAAAMQASVVAAEQAAGAAVQVWWGYEVSSVAAESRGPQRSSGDIISAGNEDEAQAFGKLLVAIANSSPVAALPIGAPHAPGTESDWVSDSSDDEGAASASDSEAGPATSGAVQQEAASAYAAAVYDAATCAAAAEAAALRAALETVRALTSSSGSGTSSSGGDPWLSPAATALMPGRSLAHASSAALTGINSTTDRGLPPLAAALQGDEGDKEGGARQEDPGGGGGLGRSDQAVEETGASRSMALRLEELVWRELDAVVQLATRLRQAARPLGDGMEQLRPPGVPPPAAAWATQQPQQQRGWQGSDGGDKKGARARAAVSLDAAYPALRRAQRLSFALASFLLESHNQEARQALLEAPSVSARLRLLLRVLRKHRSVLAAVVAVKEVDGDAGETGPSPPPAS